MLRAGWKGVYLCTRLGLLAGMGVKRGRGRWPEGRWRCEGLGGQVCGEGGINIEMMLSPSATIHHALDRAEGETRRHLITRFMHSEWRSIKASGDVWVIGHQKLRFVKIIVPLYVYAYGHSSRETSLASDKRYQYRSNVFCLSYNAPTSMHPEYRNPVRHPPAFLERLSNALYTKISA